MYTINNIIYSAPGYILVGDKFQGFQCDINDFELIEVPVVITDMVKKGRQIVYNNGTLRELVDSNTKYGDLKSKFIKQRYSNDDQIAIMLNKDNSEEDKEKYMQMQAWREWSATLAKAIINTMNNG